MRQIISLSVVLVVGACAPLKDLTVIPGLTDAFNKQVNVAPAFFQNLANDYLIADEEFRLLTGRSCDSLGTPAILDFKGIPLTRKLKNGKTEVITYAQYEQDRLSVKSKALEFLAKYAGQMRDRAQAAASFSSAISFANSTADIAASVPVVGVQAGPYTQAAKGILAVLDRFQNDATAAAIVEIAIEAKPHLKKMLDQIKSDYGVINVDAKIYLAAWKDCALAKLDAMRTPLTGLSSPSAVEMDVAYSAFLQKIVDYQKSIPTVDDELDAIESANNKIANNDFQSILNASQELVGAANAAYAAIQAVQKLN